MKIEDIIFWVLITLIVGVALWKLVGSPTDTATLIAITLFVAGSEILIWRKMFAVENKTAIGFVKLRSEIDNKFNLLRSDIGNKFNQLSNKLEARRR